MTPAARVQAAIEALDEILSGKNVEMVLTGWARRSRFAGSGDRAAVRDHVFDALRSRKSLAALGGGETGRGLMLGALRRDGIAPDGVFGAGRHAPAELTPAERAGRRDPVPGPEALDIPLWLWPEFRRSLGPDTESVATLLKSRAPVHLRVNRQKASREVARETLAAEGVVCRPHAASETALEVDEGQRKIRQSGAYLDGVVELQDAASQGVVDALDLGPGKRVLDYCAGGGGKALAAAATGARVWAHDASAERMRDIPTRARRAGVDIPLLGNADPGRTGPFDVVLCDAPCSGSGSWRRSPEGKWKLSEPGLAELNEIQSGILRAAAPLVAPGGILAYATCSVLHCENTDVVEKFLGSSGDWELVWQKAWSVTGGTDGFYSAHLTRKS